MKIWNTPLKKTTPTWSHHENRSTRTP